MSNQLMLNFIVNIVFALNFFFFIGHLGVTGYYILGEDWKQTANRWILIVFGWLLIAISLAFVGTFSNATFT